MKAWHMNKMEYQQKHKKNEMVKKVITDLKNSWQETNSRLDQAEQRINELKGGSFEIESEEKRKTVKKA